VNLTSVRYVPLTNALFINPAAKNTQAKGLCIAIAQGLLKKELPVRFVHNEIGYEHGSVLSRVFKKNRVITKRMVIKNKNTIQTH